MDRALVQEPIEILRGLADTVALLDGKARGKSVVMTLSAPPDLPAISGISGEGNQVWLNLIDNAIDAAPPHDHVTVTATKEDANVVVSVLDDGPGIPPEIKERIFDPFFTTKPVGEGTALDIVRRIVQWHAGEIEVDSRPGHTEFRVRLPVAGSQKSVEGYNTDAEPPQGRIECRQERARLRPDRRYPVSD
jgi:signal transduction histidine kinase